MPKTYQVVLFQGCKSAHIPRNLMRIFLVFCLLLFTSISKAERNLIVVTLDGLRWQEVFRGADENLIAHQDFVKKPEALKQAFWHQEHKQRRQRLMPFFWQTIVEQGTVIGNRDIGSKMSVANPWYFSYPGYSEIFTGVVDESIDSNRKIPNPQISFLEWLNKQDKFEGKLAAFGSWDVFPYIFNVERSKLYVNAGFDSAGGYPLSAEVKLLNELQKEIPSPWHSVRLDAFTHRFAKDYLLTVKPKVMAIAYGETDDFAHDGAYDQYLHAAKRTDQFIADLWRTIQTTPGYKNNTNVLIVTDHGRGSYPEDWQHHASKRSLAGYMKGLSHFPEGIIGSEHIWFAAIGPDIPARGVVKTKVEVKQSQVAATAMKLLGYQPQTFNPDIAPAIAELFNQEN